MTNWTKSWAGRLDCDWMIIDRCVERDGHVQSRGGSLGHCAPTRQLESSVVSGIQPAPHLRPQPLPPRVAAAAEVTGRGELGSWAAPASVKFTGDQLCAACCLWKRKSEAVGGWYFSSTRLAARGEETSSSLSSCGDWRTD